MARVFGLLFICCLVLGCVDAKRGQRINIFKQGRGDIAQIRRAGNNAIFNSLRRNSTKKWDYLKDSSGNNIVPYVIQGTYKSDELAIIKGVMKRLEENVCVRFRPRTNEPDYIEFQNVYFQGCYATVGRVPGKNVVMLEANDIATCIEHDIVIHEVMHTLGLWHEHMRYDRDSFIKIIWDNIPLYDMPQFEKIGEQESTTYDINYDYRSVMHYPQDACVKVPGKITVQTLDPAAQALIGTQEDASPGDYKKLCFVYHCNQCMGKPITNQTTPFPPTPTTTTTTRTRRPPTTTTTTPPTTTRTRRPPTTTTTTPPTTPPSPSKKCSDQFGPFCQEVLSVKRDACISWDSFMSINCCQTCKKLDKQNKKLEKQKAKLDKQNKKLEKQNAKSDIRMPESHWEPKPNNFAFDGWF